MCVCVCIDRRLVVVVWAHTAIASGLLTTLLLLKHRSMAIRSGLAATLALLGLYSNKLVFSEVVN